jgi:hypothetical protein
MLAPEQHEKNDDRNWDADQPKQRAFTETHGELLLCQCGRKAGAFPPAGLVVCCYLVVAGAEEGAAGGGVSVVRPEPVVSGARG